MLTFLHTADIHLDPPFSSLSPQQAAKRREQLRATFQSMIQYIRDEQIPLALISGDLFDSPTPQMDTLRFAFSAMEAAQNCRFFISPGNHDYGSKVWDAFPLPQNVTVFRGGQLSFRTCRIGEHEVTVWGWGFETESLSKDPLLGFGGVDTRRINLLCAHCTLDKPDSPYAPVSKKELQAAGFDYAALGHVHNADHMKKLGNTYYAYAGCLEGRSFDEIGKKGAYLIRLEKEGEQNNSLSFHAKRIRFTRRHYEQNTLDITGAEQMQDVTQKVAQLISDCGYDADTFLRIILRGQVPTSLLLSIPVLEEQDWGVEMLRLIDQTTPMIAQDELEHDPTIRGAFYKQLKPMLENDDAQIQATARLALQLGLHALNGEELPW